MAWGKSKKKNESASFKSLLARVDEVAGPGETLDGAGRRPDNVYHLPTEMPLERAHRRPQDAAGHRSGVSRGQLLAGLSGTATVLVLAGLVASTWFDRRSTAADKTTSAKTHPASTPVVVASAAAIPTVTPATIAKVPAPAPAVSAGRDERPRTIPSDGPPVILVPHDDRLRRRNTETSQNQTTSSSASEPPATRAASEPTTRREPKLLASPTLRLRAGEAAVLAMMVDAGGQAVDRFRVMITGLPAGATLSAGKATGTSTWQLPATAAEGVQLRLPTTLAETFALALELQDGEGNSLARSTTVVAVLAVPQPPAAPPPAPSAPAGGTPIVVAPSQPMVPAPSSDAPKTAPRLTMDDDTAFIERGRLMARNGDIAGARLLFERAADAGSGRGALLLGETYDPEVLASLSVLGVKGDIAKARRWYARASDLGMPQAGERLKALAGR